MNVTPDLFDADIPRSHYRPFTVQIGLAKAPSLFPERRRNGRKFRTVEAVFVFQTGILVSSNELSI